VCWLVEWLAPCMLLVCWWLAPCAIGSMDFGYTGEVGEGCWLLAALLHMCRLGLDECM
jgi:hypothetical protein